MVSFLWRREHSRRAYTAIKMKMKDSVIYISEGGSIRIEFPAKSKVVIQRSDLGRVFRLNLDNAEFTSSSTMLVPKGSFARLTAGHKKDENNEIVEVDRKLFHIPKEFKMIQHHRDTSPLDCT